MPKLMMQGLAPGPYWGHVDQNWLFEPLKQQSTILQSYMLLDKIAYALSVLFLLRFLVALA
jgi:hypothetical protein